MELRGGVCPGQSHWLSDLDQAKERVGHAGLRGEIVHLVVEEEAGRRCDVSSRKLSLSGVGAWQRRAKQHPLPEKMRGGGPSPRLTMVGALRWR